MVWEEQNRDIMEGCIELCID